MVARVRKRFVYANINKEMAGNKSAGVVREISMGGIISVQTSPPTPLLQGEGSLFPKNKTAGDEPAVVIYTFKSSGRIGICLIRFPVAAKTAFATAGAI